MFVDLSPTALHILCGHIHHVANLNVLGEEDAEACQRAAKALDFFGRLAAAEDKILDAAQRVHDAYCGGNGEVSVSEMANLERAIAAHSQQRSKLHLATVSSASTPLPAGQLAAAQAMRAAIYMLRVSLSDHDHKTLDADKRELATRAYAAGADAMHAWDRATAAAPEGGPAHPVVRAERLRSIHIAEGCHDMNGGHVGNQECLDAFHQGIQTVVHALSAGLSAEPTPPAPPAAPSAALCGEARVWDRGEEPYITPYPCVLPAGHKGHHADDKGAEWDHLPPQAAAPAAGKTWRERLLDAGVCHVATLMLADLLDEARASGEGER